LCSESLSGFRFGPDGAWDRGSKWNPLLARRADRAAHAVKRARREFSGEQAAPVGKAGQPKSGGPLCREAEAPVVRRFTS